MASADQMSLTELYSEGFFQIPEFQRNYSWKSQQIRDLIDDMLYLHRQKYRDESQEGEDQASGPEIHYFGQLLLQDSGRTFANEDGLVEYRIIDGQQRMLTVPIFVRAILDQLAAAEPDSNPPNYVDSASESSDETPQEVYEDHLDAVEDTFFKYDGRLRVRPTDADRSVFESIINASSSVSDDDVDRPSNEYLKQAYEDIRGSLRSDLFGQAVSEIREQEEPETEEDYDTELSDAGVGDRGDLDYLYSLKLIELLQIIAEVFTVTRFIIEETGEAGRFFETQNDRGRDLTTKDLIKGYLIYCANKLDDHNFAEEISGAFKRVTETITKHEGADEGTVETFLNSHWRMFNGDPTFDRSSNEITDIHRIIKQVANHAHIDRTDENLKEWIQVYITSLQASAKAYGKTRYPESIDTTEGDQAEEIQSALYGIRACGAPSNTAALAIAARIAFADSDPDKYLEILRLLEKFTFRVYQLSGESKASQRKKMNRMAFKLHWAEATWLEDVDSDGDIFEVESDQLTDHQFTRSVKDEKVYEDLESGFATVCDQIESGIGNYAPRVRMRNRLSRLDLQNGDDEDDNWNGMSNDAQRYLFFNYEKMLRDSLGHGGDSLKWDEWKDHVDIIGLFNDGVGESHGLDADTIARHQDAISAVFPVEAHSEGDFDDTWDDVFDTVFLEEGFFVGENTGDPEVGPFAMFRDFVLEEDESYSSGSDSAPDLTEELLEEQKRKRIAWGLENWEVPSKAWVVIDDPDQLGPDEMQTIASHVRADYKDTDTGEYNIPHVDVVSIDDVEDIEEWSVETGEHSIDDSEDVSPESIAVTTYENEGAITYSVESSENDEDEDSAEEEETEPNTGSLSTPPYLVKREYYEPDESSSD